MSKFIIHLFSSFKTIFLSMKKHLKQKIVFFFDGIVFLFDAGVVQRKKGLGNKCTIFIIVVKACCLSILNTHHHQAFPTAKKHPADL